ncbi:MAG TPA: LysM domain-containing protein [Candidatus Obscuribacterales bacterium]
MAIGSGFPSPVSAPSRKPADFDRFHVHSDGSITYTVQEGDNLSLIARRAFQSEHGRSPDARELLNTVLHIDGKNQLRGQLRVGQVLEWKSGLGMF